MNDQIVDAYYRDHYATAHSSGSLGKAHSRIHRSLEAPRVSEVFPVTLELGAGNFEHTAFIRHGWRDYVAVDVRTPPHETLMRARAMLAPRQLTFVSGDAVHLPFSDNFADRVVAGCLIMHLVNPAQAVTEWQRVCSPQGVIDFVVPCDPGLATRVFRRLISEREVRRHGISADDYRIVNALEHLSSFGRILTLTRSAVEPSRRLHVKYFPFRWLHSWNANAYAIFSIQPRGLHG